MNKIELGKKLATWREGQGWTQRDFAKKLKVSLLTIQNWELGISAPNLTRYSEIAQLLGVTLQEMGLTENLNPESLGDRIKFARLARGFSIEQFAHEFGFAIQAVKSWENHTLEVSELTISRIAKALQLPLGYFSLSNSSPFQWGSQAA